MDSEESEVYNRELESVNPFTTTMALPRKVSKIDDVDEKYRELYVEKDGAFVLDTEDDTEYKRKLDEFRTNNRNLHKEKEELEKRLKEYDPDKYRQGLEALEKLNKITDKELLEAGKLEEYLARRTAPMQEDFSRQIRAKDELIRAAAQERDALRARLGATLIDAEVQKSAERAGKLRKGALVDVLNRARQVWQIDQNGTMVPKQGDQTLFGKDGNALSMDEWAEHLREEAPHFFEPSQGGGSTGNAVGNQDAGVKYVSRDDLVGISKYAEQIAKGTVLVR